MGRQVGRDRGPRVQRHDRRGRARSRGRLAGRGTGHPRAVTTLRHVRVLPGAAPVAVRGARARRRRRRRLAGRVRRLQGRSVGPAAPHPGAPRVEACGADRTDGGRTARHHARRWCPAGHPLARHRWRSDRLPLRGRAESDGRRRHRRERAARTPPRAVREARRAHGAPGRSRAAGDAARHGRRAVRRACSSARATTRRWKPGSRS